MGDSEQTDSVLRFHDFQVNLKSGEMWKAGIRLKLQDQPFKVLVALLHRPGEVVTREELHHLIWPQESFGDFDHAINLAIAKLRATSGDSADVPHLIETLPRRGYRFVAPVHPVVVKKDLLPRHGNGLTAATLPGRIHPKLAYSPKIGWALSLAAVLSIAAILFSVNAGGLRNKLWRHSSARPQIRSLAVLPLINMSGDPEQEYFVDGMTDELVAELSRINSLKVISRTSVMRYKGQKNKSLSEIGRELNVDAVMEGAVIRSNSRVRIVAQLIYAPTDQHLWAETYERDLGDVLKLEDDVAESITQQVGVVLTSEQRARLHQATEVNPDAYEAYLLAHTADLSRLQGITTAQSHYETAIQKDPRFAPAYVGLAVVYLNLGDYRWLSPHDAYTPAKQFLLKSLELNQASCDANAALSWVSWRYEWDWPGAERELRRALELCPNSAKLHSIYAYYKGWSGHGADALAELQKARELYMFCPCLDIYEAVINVHLRKYEAMIQPSRAEIESDQNSWQGHSLLATAYEGLGRPEEAIPEYQKAVELSQGDQDPTASLASVYVVTGRRAEAQKILSRWLRQSETSYISPYMIATVYASLGDKDKAFQYLEKAYHEHSSDLPYFLRADLRIDSLHSDSRFQDLVRRMNFPQ
ncbi:MAG: tetratricopeptide repeat protein [Candidatus Acidiferrum sp.]